MQNADHGIASTNRAPVCVRMCLCFDMFFWCSKMLVSWCCFRTCWFLSTKQKIAATSPTTALVTTSETFTLPSAVPGSMTKSPHAFHQNYMLPRGAHQNPLKPCGPWPPPHASLQELQKANLCGKKHNVWRAGYRTKTLRIMPATQTDTATSERIAPAKRSEGKVALNCSAGRDAQ